MSDSCMSRSVFILVVLTFIVLVGLIDKPLPPGKPPNENAIVAPQCSIALSEPTKSECETYHRELLSRGYVRAPDSSVYVLYHHQER